MTPFASSSALPDSLKDSGVIGDVTRHCLWVLAVRETCGPFLTGKAYFSGDVIMFLFLRVYWVATVSLHVLHVDDQIVCNGYVTL